MRPKIPTLSKKAVAMLGKWIVPLVRFAKTKPHGILVHTHHPKGALYFVDVPKEEKEQSFLWIAKPRKQARGIRKHGTITTLHAPNRYGLFAPTIAEVFAQIPPMEFEHAVAFEILPIQTPFPREHGYFETTVILYQKS